MKSMKQTVELEKRIFLSYFFITFFLVILLLCIEWQVARWGINQYEETEMNNSLAEFDLVKNTESLRLRSAVGSLLKQGEKAMR